MSTTFADKSGRGLLLTALNKAASEKNVQFTKTDLVFGPIVPAQSGDRESQFTYSAAADSRFEGETIGYLNRLDLTSIFTSAGIEVVELTKGPATAAELVSALNARFGLDFSEEDIDHVGEVAGDAMEYTLTALPGSYAFKGNLVVSLVDAKTPIDDVVDTPVDPELEVEVPEYLVDATVVTADLASKAQTVDGKMLAGTGNPVGEMTVASNGELELAVGARVWKSGTLVEPVDGHYDIELANDSGDWNFPFSIALLQEDRPVTDIYDVTLTLQSIETEQSIEFALSRDSEGVYHFANEALGLDIVDSVQTESGSVVQNIQRATFYKAQLGNPTTNASGAAIGDFLVGMNAVRRTGLVEPLVVEISASVSVSPAV